MSVGTVHSLRSRPGLLSGARKRDVEQIRPHVYARRQVKDQTPLAERLLKHKNYSNEKYSNAMFVIVVKMEIT